MVIHVFTDITVTSTVCSCILSCFQPNDVNKYDIGDCTLHGVHFVKTYIHLYSFSLRRCHHMYDITRNKTEAIISSST